MSNECLDMLAGRPVKTRSYLRVETTLMNDQLHRQTAEWCGGAARAEEHLQQPKPRRPWSSTDALSAGRFPLIGRGHALHLRGLSPQR